MSYYKPGLVNGDIILKLESTIEQFKQERILYEKQYHDLIFTNEKLNAELYSLKKVYNDLAESHAKQVIEITDLIKERDSIIQEKWDCINDANITIKELQSELLKAKELLNTCIDFVRAESLVIEIDEFLNKK